MNSTDLITMLGNLSQSLFPVQRLLTGGAYLIALFFFITALSKLRLVVGATRGGGSHERISGPLAYFLAGAALLYLPSMVKALANTAFGVGNVLQYIQYNPYDVQGSMGLVIETAGILWFIRGCVLLAHSSDPNFKHVYKGLAFLCAGVLAMNFQNTTMMLSSAMGQLEQVTKNAQGY